MSYDQLKHQTGMDTMSLGKLTPQQEEMWIATADLPRSPGHIFYRKLKKMLSEVNFDHEVESLCKSYYSEHCGRPSIPPGAYFRMLLIGFFEGIGSQRGIPCVKFLGPSRNLPTNDGQPISPWSSVAKTVGVVPFPWSTAVLAWCSAGSCR